MEDNFKTIFSSGLSDSTLIRIANKVFNEERITPEEGMYLFENAELPYLAVLANFIKERLTGKYVYFNRNIHVEPTNICVYNCKFCSYRRKENEEGSWDYSYEDIIEKIKTYKDSSITELHMTGGVHPKRDVHFFGNIFKGIKEIIPTLHIKALSAVEIYYIAKYSKLSFKETLEILKEYGLDSIPGGGAEIFDEELRKQICPDKAGSEDWLKIHQTAHELGFTSNATILYGHIETYAHRIDHMSRLRDLQDITNGFGTYIPLKFKRENNFLSHIVETSMIEDLKNYAISRIYLDNFKHLKAYWPMIGKNLAQLSLSFGVDDIDGTIDDSTKIYSMAGADDKNPKLSSEALIALVKEANKIPVERDTLFNQVKIYN